MRPFPPADQMSFLHGNELIGINIGRYQIGFVFDGSTLLVEYGLEYVDAEGQTHKYDPQDRDGSDPMTLHHLIGDRISQVGSEGLRLTLSFASGRKLIVLSDDGPYESGHVFEMGYGEQGVQRRGGFYF
jgi:hypothetical protein